MGGLLHDYRGFRLGFSSTRKRTPMTTPDLSLPHFPDLAGRAILVVGASSGIGAATALALARQGARVALAARRAAELTELAAQVQAAGGEALVLPTDVTDEAQVAATVAATVATWGRLDGAFNNAGLLGAVTPLTDTDAGALEQVLRTNVLGVFHALKHEMAAMAKTGGGAIVNTASIVAQVAFPGFGAYTASKHAVIGLTRTAALEGWSQGIRVNAVSPGPIETPMAELGFGSRDNLHAALAGTPAGRPGTPEEVSGAVLYLLAQASRYVNGATLTVDGGFTLS